MPSTPVVFIGFNRPELTARTFAAIRDRRPEDLFLLLDGPRAERPGEVSLCARVRQIVSEVDWECRVHRRFAAENLGCEPNIESGLDWVFGQVDRAIILEDDCIPDASFFRFAEELLERYAEDERVWQVSGNSHEITPDAYGDDSYGFPTYGSVWGWATWRRAWQAHRRDFPRTHPVPGITSPPVRVGPSVPAPGALVTRAGQRHYAHVAASVDGKEYSWDSHWWLTVIARDGLAASPRFNLVSNDGFGEGATHTRSSRKPTPAASMPFPLRHPGVVQRNTRAQRELEVVLVSVDGRLARAARGVIRPLWMRAIVRRIVTHRGVRGLARWLSRVRVGTSH